MSLFVNGMAVNVKKMQALLYQDKVNEDANKFQTKLLGFIFFFDV